MPRHALLAVLLLACMVGSVWQSFGGGPQTRSRTSWEAAAVLGVSAGVPKVRIKSQPDGGDIGLGVARHSALQPVDFERRVELLDTALPPRGGQRFPIPARAPPFS